MSRIDRYVFREAFVSTVITMVVLLVIFMSNQFAETLGEAAADLLPRDAVFDVFLLQFIQYLSLLAPVGVLIGILLALARLNRDSEMAALSSCGVGPVNLLKPIGFMSLLLALGVAWLSLFKAPDASREIEEIRMRAQEELELGALEPGRFTTINGGDTVVYVAEIDADRGTPLGLFIEQEEDETKIVVLAEEGEVVANTDSGELQLELRNGRRYIGSPGDAEFYIEEFGGHGIPIRMETREFVESIESRSTLGLLASRDSESRAEFAWRVSAPLSILILAVLAVPLGRSSPREGKYARVGVGLLIFVIYENSLSIARVWIERDSVPEWLGIWWVHGALAVLAIGLLLKQSGFGIPDSSRPAVRYEPVE